MAGTPIEQTSEVAPKVALVFSQDIAAALGLGVGRCRSRRVGHCLLLLQG